MTDKLTLGAELPPWRTTITRSNTDRRDAAKRAADRLNEIQRRLQKAAVNANGLDVAKLLLKVIQLDAAYVDSPVQESSSSGAGALVHPTGTVLNYQPVTETWEDGESVANIVDALGLVYDQDEITIAFPHNGHWVPIFARSVRHAQTCVDSDGTYPGGTDSPNTYPAKFIKIEYDETPGMQVRTITNLRAGSDPDFYVHNIVGDDSIQSGDSSSSGAGDPSSYIAVNSLIEVYHVGSQWFTCVTDDDEGRATAIEFEADEDFTTSTESFSATVVRYYQGTDPGETVTVYNAEKCSEGEGTYLFYGFACNRGMAMLDQRQDRYRIWQFQCPQSTEGSSSSSP